MMSALLKFSKDHPDFPVIDFLNQSAYDELIAVDLSADRYKYIYHVDQKYWTPSMEGVNSVFFDHVVNHVIYHDDQSVYREMLEPGGLRRRLDESDGVFSFVFRAPLLDGGWRWCEQYVVDGSRQDIPDDLIYYYVYDITSVREREREKSPNQVQGAIQPDPLTGLPREKDFYSLGDSLLSDKEKSFLMIAVDLQHFNLFNEWYGRELGDHVLGDIGRELALTAEKHGGIAGYMGGDDFVILVPAEGFSADDLFSALHNIIISHGVSVGFLPALGACYSNGKNSIYQLYDEATFACQKAKEDFKSRVIFFSSTLVKQTTDDYRILSEFKKALASGEITFFLQPQCRAVNGRIVGAEALSRWIKPDGTSIPPVSFIPTLEKYGFVPDLDRYIWEEVCKWLKKLKDAGKPTVPVSLNISPVDIFTIGVPEYFTRLIQKYDLPRSAIKVEITESAYGENSEKVRATVQELRDLGFAVLMDDFGSGFSSLNMLRELNVDMIKLDAYFLRMQENTEKKGMRILESVVNMAKTMAMPIIVEGVETNEHRAYLMSLGCRYIQGYYFYKPMPREEFETLTADPAIIDKQGFTFKFNEEFHIREFLNDDIYSDSMLNQIIGPAAIYAWHGDDVDIVRFNQGFYQAVNVPDFNERLLSIQKYMPNGESRLLTEALEKAWNDRLNGSSATLSFGKFDGSVAKFLIQFYFLNSDGKTKRFYGSARDITEIANLQQQMYLLSRFVSKTVLFISVRDDNYTFEVVAHGLESAMGITADEMEKELNNAQFYKRLIPTNESILWKIAFQCIEKKQTLSHPFKMNGVSGQVLDIIVDADYVNDPISDVRCILSLRRVNQ